MSSGLIGFEAASGTRTTGCPTAGSCGSAVGPAWSERGRPPAGYFARRTAEAWRRDLLDQARRGTLPGLIRTGATFADAARPAVPQPRTVEWHLKKVFIRLGISSRMGLHGALPSADREATPA